MRTADTDTDADTDPERSTGAKYSLPKSPDWKTPNDKG